MKKKLSGHLLYAASNDVEGRKKKLEKMYPDLYNDVYFCYTLNIEAALKEGFLGDRTKCPHCNLMHWKKGWLK
jgi:hypothetical protein